MATLQPRAAPDECRRWGPYPDIDALLTELRRRRWILYIFGTKEAPNHLGAVLQWETCADVVILRGENDASAYRMPTFADTDVFAPQLVSWQYHAPAAWTLRAVFTIQPPGQLGAPMAIERAAPQCTVPMESRRPVTIRPTWLVGTAPIQQTGGGRTNDAATQ